MDWTCARRLPPANTRRQQPGSLRYRLAAELSLQIGLPRFTWRAQDSGRILALWFLGNVPWFLANHICNFFRCLTCESRKSQLLYLPYILELRFSWAPNWSGAPLSALVDNSSFSRHRNFASPPRIKQLGRLPFPSCLPDFAP